MMTARNLLAIDPGTNGAGAFGPLDGLPKELWTLGEIPYLRPVFDKQNPPLVVIEAQRGTGRGTDFKFGTHYGRILECCRGEGVPFWLVEPQVWQKGLGVRGLPYAKRKRQLKTLAAERFPRFKVTNQNADALLIWDWARREQPWK